MWAPDPCSEWEQIQYHSARGFRACGAVVAANITSVAQKAQDNSQSRSGRSALSWETHPHTPMVFVTSLQHQPLPHARWCQWPMSHLLRWNSLWDCQADIFIAALETPDLAGFASFFVKCKRWCLPSVAFEWGRWMNPASPPRWAHLPSPWVCSEHECHCLLWAVTLKPHSGRCSNTFDKREPLCELQVQIRGNQSPRHFKAQRFTSDANVEEP